VFAIFTPFLSLIEIFFSLALSDGSNSSNTIFSYFLFLSLENSSFSQINRCCSYPP
jgi:hypothetical protein